MLTPWTLLPFALAFLDEAERGTPKDKFCQDLSIAEYQLGGLAPNLATDFSQADVVLVCLCQDVPSQSETLEMVGPSMKKFNSTDGALK